MTACLRSLKRLERTASARISFNENAIAQADPKRLQGDSTEALPSYGRSNS